MKRCVQIAVACAALAAAGPAARAQDPAAPAPASATPLSQVKWGSAMALDQVVGIVGDKAIFWSDVLLGIGARLRGGAIPPDSAEQLKLSVDVLNQIVDEEVLIQKARRDTSIKVTDHDVANQVDAGIKRVRDSFKSEAEFREALRREGLGSVEDYRRKMVDDAKRAELQQQYIAHAKKEGKLVPGLVSETEITEAFEKNKGTLPKRAATIAFHQLVISPHANEEQRRLAYVRTDSIGQVLAKDPSRFEQVAKSVSQDPASREQGGDLGWNRRGNMVPAFDRVMFAMPPNVISPVVETPFGFHLIKVDRVLPAEVKARHILIRPKIDSVDIARAHTLADSLAGAWKKGANFDSLATTFHDMREERGSATPFVRDSIPAAYQTALAGKVKGDIVGPFEIMDTRTGLPKFVLVEVLSTTEQGDYTRDEFRERIRDQLSQEKSIRRLLDNLRKETHVSVRLNALPAPLH
jgi:peptidyl-prolyl cis-trans isomerase SurA